jgi:hypothetical protein
VRPAEQVFSEKLYKLWVVHFTQSILSAVNVGILWALDPFSNKMAFLTAKLAFKLNIVLDAHIVKNLFKIDVSPLSVKNGTLTTLFVLSV